MPGESPVSGARNPGQGAASGVGPTGTVVGRVPDRDSGRSSKELSYTFEVQLDGRAMDRANRHSPAPKCDRSEQRAQRAEDGSCVSRPVECRSNAGNHQQKCHPRAGDGEPRSEEHTSELQSRLHLVCRLLLAKKNNHRYLFMPLSPRIIIPLLATSRIIPRAEPSQRHPTVPITLLASNATAHTILLLRPLVLV